MEKLNEIEESIRKNNNKKYMKFAIENFKKDEISIINDSFDNFKKDIKKYKKTKDINTGRSLMKNKLNMSYIDTIKKNLAGTIIFSLPYEEKEVKLKNNFLPFHKFFLSSIVSIPYENELFVTTGFYVLEYDKDKFSVFYFWSKTIEDGWNLQHFIITKNSLYKKSKDMRLNVVDTESLEVKLPKYKEFIFKEFNRVFHMLLKNLFYKIAKKEYTSYKKWTPNGYEKKEIIYSQDVMTHKRHFWKDSGKFKIPFMNKEELNKKGYRIEDEVFFRNGELRRDVPYLIINEFTKGEMKKRKEEHKKIEFFKKRILRCEEKIYSILRELYPDKIIRRHDRRTLKGLELDFNIPKLRLGIEYDGEQHFDRNLYEKLYGDGFDEQIKRDRKKNKLCRKKKIKLLRIKYDEPINKTYIKRKLKQINH